MRHAEPERNVEQKKSGNEGGEICVKSGASLTRCAEANFLVLTDEPWGQEMLTSGKVSEDAQEVSALSLQLFSKSKTLK